MSVQDDIANLQKQIADLQAQTVTAGVDTALGKFLAQRVIALQSFIESLQNSAGAAP